MYITLCLPHHCFQAVFSDNIRKLEAGIPMSKLPPVDAHVTESQIEKFICRYSTASDNADRRVNADGPLTVRVAVPSPETGGDNPAHSGTDNAMVESFTGSLDSTGKLEIFPAVH